MKPLILLTVFNMSLTFLACNHWKEDKKTHPVHQGNIKDSSEQFDESDPQQEDKSQNESEGKGEGHGNSIDESTQYVIFEDKAINEKTFVAQVKEGDEIILQVRGLKKTRKFSEIYRKVATSYWNDVECDSHGFIQHSNIQDCVDIGVYGKCTALYRDYVGQIESTIEFPKEPENIPLQFILGDRSYRIDKINLHKKDFVEISFNIRSGMVDEADELYIQPIYESHDSIQTGFLSYGDCPDRRKRKFKFLGITNSKHIPDDIIRTFQMNLYILEKR